MSHLPVQYSSSWSTQHAWVELKTDQECQGCMTQLLKRSINYSDAFIAAWVASGPCPTAWSQVAQPGFVHPRNQRCANQHFNRRSPRKSEELCQGQTSASQPQQDHSCSPCSSSCAQQVSNAAWGHLHPLVLNLVPASPQAAFLQYWH